MVVERAQVYLKFVGANVHRLRVKAGVTQETFAEVAGLDIRFVRRVERATVNLRFDTFIRLADALGVEPGQLLRRVKPVAPKSGRPKKKTAAKGGRRLAGG
jgi:transcriptional regulator with XRE-family HTH domain